MSFRNHYLQIMDRTFHVPEVLILTIESTGPLLLMLTCLINSLLIKVAEYHILLSWYSQQRCESTDQQVILLSISYVYLIEWEMQLFSPSFGGNGNIVNNVRCVSKCQDIEIFALRFKILGNNIGKYTLVP